MPGPRKSRKGITRIDQPDKHTHGWYVRVNFHGKQIAKFFSDRSAGGKKKAMEQALAFRDDAEKKLGKPRTDRQVISRSPTGERNATIGVRLVNKTSRTAGGDTRRHPVYEVTWSPAPNVTQRTSVSIDKYGKREAFRRACEIRTEKEREIYGDTGRRR